MLPERSSAPGRVPEAQLVSLGLAVNAGPSGTAMSEQASRTGFLGAANRLLWVPHLELIQGRS